VLAEHCRKVGRDVEDILINWQCQVVSIADSRAEAEHFAELNPLFPHSQASAIIGTPDQVRDALQGFVDVGVRDFILRFADFPRLDGVRRFEREVAPHLRP
jgi:alkanesulfonate monooxygenase SsuD/methylene tetrahydromethanopterin reductase-like flavin-dependent oxidoreductase (luciferase family)